MATKAEVEILLKRKNELVKGLEEVASTFKKVEGKIDALAGKKIDLDISLIEAKVKRLKDIKIELDAKSIEKAEKSIKRLADGATRDIKKLAKDIEKAKPFEALPKGLAKAQKKLDAGFKRLNTRFKQAVAKLKAERAFDPLSKSAKKAERDVAAAARSIINFAQKVPPALQRAGTGFSKVADGAAKARAQLDKFDKSKKGVDALTGSVKRLIAAFLSFQAAKIAIRNVVELGKASASAAVDLVRLTNILETTPGLAGKAADILGRLAEKAERFGVSLEPLQRNFALFAATAARAGLTLEETESIYQTVITASAALGLASEDVDSVIRQLIQGLAKNKLEWQDIRIIMERIPGIAEDIRKGLGLDKEAFDDLRKKGLIPAKEAFLAMGLAIEESFGPGARKNAESILGSIGRMETAVLKLKRRIGLELLPELEAWLTLIVRIASESETAAERSGNAITRLSAKIREGVETVFAALAGNRDALVFETKAAIATLLQDILAGVIKSGEQITSFFGLFENVASRGIADVEERFRAWSDGVIQGFEDQAESARQSFKEQSSDYKASIEERADADAKRLEGLKIQRDKAREDLLRGLKDDEAAEKASLAKRLDTFAKFFSDQRALELGGGGGAQDVTFSATGIAGVAEEIARLQETIARLGPQLVRTNEELNEIAAAKTRLQELTGGFDSTTSAVAQVADATKRASDFLSGLVDILEPQGKDGGAFGQFSGAAQRALILIGEELARMVERGRVSQAELKPIMAAVGQLFRDAGISVGELGSEAEQAAQKLRGLALAQVEANQAATGLGASAEEAGGRILVLEGAGERGRTVFTQWKDAAIETAKEIDKLTGSTTVFSSETDRAGAAVRIVAGEMPKVADASTIAGGALDFLFKRTIVTKDGLVLTGQAARDYSKAAEELAKTTGKLSERTGLARVKISNLEPALKKAAGASTIAGGALTEFFKVTETGADGVSRVVSLAERLARSSKDVATEAPKAATGVDQLATSAAAAGPALDAAAAPAQKVADAVKEVSTSAKEAAAALPAVATQVTAIATAAEQATSGDALKTFFEELSKPVPDLEKLVPLLKAIQETIEKILEDAENSDSAEKLVRFFSDLTSEQITSGTKTLGENLAVISTNLKLVGRDAAGAKEKLAQLRTGIRSLLKTLRTYIEFAKSELPAAVSVIVVEFAKINEAIQRQLEELELLRLSFDETLAAHGLMVAGILGGNEAMIESYAAVVRARDGALNDGT